MKLTKLNCETNKSQVDIDYENDSHTEIVEKVDKRYAFDIEISGEFTMGETDKLLRLIDSFIEE